MTEALVWGVAGGLILMIMVALYGLIKMAGHADEMEDAKLREEGYYGED